MLTDSHSQVLSDNLKLFCNSKLPEGFKCKPLEFLMHFNEMATACICKIRKLLLLGLPNVDACVYW